MEKKLQTLKNILDSSRYTVALCGSGILKECGYPGILSLDVAYDIENRYGDSPEYIYSSAYFSTRPEKFFKFYKSEILDKDLEPSETFYALAELEKQGKLQTIISKNSFSLSERAGCKHVYNIYGTIHKNICTHCGKEYPVEFVKTSPSVPLCEECGHIIRPNVKLFGEMLDHEIIAKIADEIAKADVLLLLGTSLESYTYKNYIKYFRGNSIVVVHQNPHYSDVRTNLVFLDTPKNVLPKILER